MQAPLSGYFRGGGRGFVHAHLLDLTVCRTLFAEMRFLVVLVLFIFASVDAQQKLTNVEAERRGCMDAQQHVFIDVFSIPTRFAIRSETFVFTLIIVIATFAGRAGAQSLDVPATASYLQRVRERASLARTSSRRETCIVLLL